MTLATYGRPGGQRIGRKSRYYSPVTSGGGMTSDVPRAFACHELLDTANGEPLCFVPHRLRVHRCSPAKVRWLSD